MCGMFSILCLDTARDRSLKKCVAGPNIKSRLKKKRQSDSISINLCHC
uniref:Uncharacterized protein n=1 Tax=Anguilla anguilla TaxID=7936 RepID=A0A0E9WWJ9_ANGAN